MAKPKLGTKRVCPETGRKFYDLNRDPVVSPYSGKSYSLSFFEGDVAVSRTDPPPEEPDTRTKGRDDDAQAETISLEEADDEAAAAGTGANVDGDDADDDISEGGGDDTFLESDDGDVSDIISVADDEEEA